MATSPITQDVVNGVPVTGSTAAPRKITSSLTPGSMSSEIESAGNQKIFADPKKSLGKQDFLQLLVTQLKHQDPMAPSENQEFVAQLAQFSSLEGTQNINSSIEELSKKMEAMVSNQTNSSTSISNSSATNLIGKTVRVAAKDVVWDPSLNKPLQISVHADTGEESVLSVVDSQGQIINVVPLPKAGESALSWDGSKLDGSKAPAGKYELKVTSKDGIKDTGYTFFEDKVAGIAYSKTGMLLEVRGQKIGLDQVLHVGEAPVAAAK